MGPPPDDPEGLDVPPDPPEPIVDPTAGKLDPDAPLETKADWLRGSYGLPGMPGGEPHAPGGTEDVQPSAADWVQPLPLAPVGAPGSRAPRRAADTNNVDPGARGNWVPTGPRNVGGRITSFAVNPANPAIMFAGSASGGVFRTRNGGEEWEALWHDQPSLPIGALGICAGTPATVYAATGENEIGGGPLIAGNGVYRSDDGGDTWANPSPAVPPLPGTAPNLAYSFEALAVHPVDRLHCWAVGRAGIFRTLDGGASWTQFEAGIHYSDVAFSVAAAAGNPPIVYLVCARSVAGEATIVRLDAPAAPDAAITAAIAAAANRSRVVAPPPPPPPPAAGVLQDPPLRPTRGKLAISASRPDIAYVRFVSEGRGHLGLFRTRQARATPWSGATWVRLRDSIDWQLERQGEYNLTIAVDPTDPNNVATGMVDLYLSRNANATSTSVRWLHAMVWQLYQIDRGHHADHHQTLFALQPGAPPGTPPALWVANDGGISRSTDWRTGAGYPNEVRRPLGPGHPPVLRVDLDFPFSGVDQNDQPVAAPPISWRKRSHGIVAAQMYDLTQSPLVSTLYGCGFQDNGVFVTTGGPTWRFVLGADGGFVAFDADDPYRMLATWQGGISEVDFPGTIDGTFPVPGDPIVAGLWPRALLDGFTDDAPFVAQTAAHPRKAGRTLHTRVSRLYGTPPSGERWAPELVGQIVDIRYSGTANRPLLEVLPSAGALRLGLRPQVSARGVQTALTEPFALQAGDTLRLRIDGNLTTVTFNPGGQIANLAHASAAEVAAYVAARVPAAQPTATALPGFQAAGLGVELTTTQAGAAQQIVLGGSALAPIAGSVSRLGLLAGTYTGDAQSPATVTLGRPGSTPRDFTRNRDFSTGGAPLELTVAVNGGAVRRITFAPPAFPDPSWVRTGELEAALRAALAADPVTVCGRTAFKAVRLADGGGNGFFVSGSAASRLNLPVGGAFTFLFAGLRPRRDQALGQNAGNVETVDLTPPGAAPDLQLVVSQLNPPGPAISTPPLVFSAAIAVGNRRAVTMEELARLIGAHIAAQPAAAQPAVQVDVAEFPDLGKPTAVRYADGDPDIAFVGGEAGALYVTRNDGLVWANVADPRFRLRDRSVQAVAIHPDDSRTVWVGLGGRTVPGADPGFLFVTRDGGATWAPAGNGLVDAGGAPLGVNALEVDPDNPAVLWAATAVGVFRTTDSAASWQPFNEGLPATHVIDLAFSPGPRLLRAGAWGRGAWERHVGDRAPQDVRLSVRVNELDDGVRPAPSGPDLYSATPVATAVARSPDIKVNRDRPAGIGADELVDGVEFDLDIVHEPPVAGASNVYVQVHNRGSFPATSLRLVALWADTSAGLPPLPADLWTRFAAGTLGGLAGPWRLVGDFAPTGAAAISVAPGQPRVHTFAGFVWPNELDGMRRIGILVLASSTEDALTATALDVPTLLATEPKIAFRETPVVRTADDRALFLTQTGPALFAVANPAAGTSAAPALGVPAAAVGGPAAPFQALGSEPFNLTAGAPQSLAFSTPVQSIAIPIQQGPNDIPNLAAATANEVAAVVNRALVLAGLPVRASIAPIPAPPPPNGFAFVLTLQGGGGATVAVTPPPAPAVDAAPTLGFAAGPAAPRLNGAGGPFAFPAGGATLQLNVTVSATIRLPVSAFANPAQATAREVRRVLNRGFLEQRLPIAAVVPRVDLWIKRSPTDEGAVPSTLGRHALAEIVARPAAVAAGAAQARLFDLVAEHAADALTANADNFFYVRSSNFGSAGQTDARHRLFALDLSATPITATAAGAPAAATVPAGGTAIAELRWNPGARAAGDRVFLLAVVDHDPDRPLAVPPTFASLDALEAFCTANGNAAYREFAVG